jgi:hypothetical protein
LVCIEERGVGEMRGSAAGWGITLVLTGWVDQVRVGLGRAYNNCPYSAELAHYIVDTFSNECKQLATTISLQNYNNKTLEMP